MEVTWDMFGITITCEDGAECRVNGRPDLDRVVFERAETVIKSFGGTPDDFPVMRQLKNCHVHRMVDRMFDDVAVGGDEKGGG